MLDHGGLGLAFQRSLRLHEEKTAIEFDRSSISYGRLAAWSAAIGSSLRTQGVRPGDKVALLIGNRPEFVACDIAVATIGAVKLPVNTLLPTHTISHIIEDSGARALVVDPRLEEVAIEAVGDRRILLYGFGEGSGGGADPFIRLVLPADGGDAPVADVAKVEAGAPAALFYTGGTTGRPKGVVHSQRSLLSFHTAQLLEAEIRQHERLLLATPLAHAAGLFAQSAILRGATIVLHDGFDVERTAAALRDNGITWTFLVPTMIYRLLDAVGSGGAKGGFPALDTIVYGAAPIAQSRLQRALEVFGPVFIQLYGQTECPNWGTRLAKTDHDPARPERLTSCGQASFMVDVKIVDENGETLPPGEVGEVCLKGPYTLTEYHRNPEATAEKFLGDWIRTGDVGLLDAAGYLYLKDRRADMIISGGMNVYSSEVEDVLNAHPQVRSAAVIGIPHDDWGEAVHAIVVGDGRLTAHELMEWSRNRLAGYARPKSVEFVDALPETPFGKIDKKRLREKYWKGSDRGIN